MPTNNKNNFDLTKPLNYTERSIMARNLDMIESQRHSSSSYDQKKALKEQEESQKRINQAREASERRLAQEREAAERRMNQEREAAERRISQEQEQRTRRELELQEQYARRAAAIERQNAEEQLAYEQEYRRKQMAVSYTEYDPENELYYYYDHKGDYIDTIEARLRWQTINCKSYTTYDPDDEFWQYFLDKEGEVIPRDEARKLWELENCPDFKDFDPEGNWTMYRLGDGYISREEALEKWKAENADSPEVKRLNCEKIVYSIRKTLIDETVAFPTEWEHDIKVTDLGDIPNKEQNKNNLVDKETLKKLSVQKDELEKRSNRFLFMLYSLGGIFGLIIFAGMTGMEEGLDVTAAMAYLIPLALVLIIVMIFWRNSINKQFEGAKIAYNMAKEMYQKEIDKRNSEFSDTLYELNEILDGIDVDYPRESYRYKSDFENVDKYYSNFASTYWAYNEVRRIVNSVKKKLPDFNCTIVSYYDISYVLPLDSTSIIGLKPLIDFTQNYNHIMKSGNYPSESKEQKLIIESVDHMTENDIKKGLSATISYITAKGAEQIKEKLEEAGISSTITKKDIRFYKTD